MFKKLLPFIIIAIPVIIVVVVANSYFIKDKKLSLPPLTSIIPQLKFKADDSGATTEGVQSLVDANNQFALELYSKYRIGENNLFFSPYSISAALAMTYEGAKNQTAEEIQRVFHFPEDEEIRRPAFAKIYNEINKGGKNYKLNTANALWAEKNFQFLKEYFNVIRKYYGGKATNLDFKKNPESSRVTINNWVAKQTNQKIKDLIKQLTEDTRLVLTNAIYFKGDWLVQFDKAKTKEEDFRVNAGKAVRIPMMSLISEKVEFNYGETEGMQILELPYEGKDLSMLVLLPQNDNLQSLEERLNPETLKQWREMLKEEKVNIYLPKFKLETEYEMARDLMGMGMPTAFSAGADFSGMTGKADLFISQVIHKAFVDVNEEGTEAAAATAVIIMEKGLSPTKTFRVDHPFIFLIQQKETGNILFLGRVVDPTM